MSLVFNHRGQPQASGGGGGGGGAVTATAPLVVTGSGPYNVALQYTANFLNNGSNQLAINPATPITLNDSVAFRGPTLALAYEDAGVASFGSFAGDSEVNAGALFGVTLPGGVVALFDARGMRTSPGGAYSTALPASGGVMVGASGGLYSDTGAAAKALLVAGAAETTLGDTTAPTRLGSGWRERRTAVAADYTVLASDHYVGVTSTAAPRVMTLPAPAAGNAGAEFIIADESGNAGNSSLTVVASGGALINGQATWRIYDNYGAVRLVSTGTAYRVVAATPGTSTSGQVLTATGDGSTQWANNGVQFATWKPTVRAVSFANVASLSGTTTIDGVALVAGDDVLLVGQSTPANNGPWTVQAGAWTRPTWFDSNPKVLLGHVITVREGTNLAHSGWENTNLTAVNLGVTSITYRGVPIEGVVQAADGADLLVWRRNSGLLKATLFSSDGSGNLIVGNTAGSAALILLANSDIRLTTTAAASPNQCNLGITNTSFIFNFGSGGTAVDWFRATSTPTLEAVLGERENNTGFAPVLVPLRGTQPANNSTNGTSSGLEFNTGRGNGTAVSTGVLTGYVPVASGTTAQSTKNTVFTWTGQYVRVGKGWALTPRAVAGGNTTATIEDALLEYTAAPGTGIVTLPAANAVPAGWTLVVRDFFGGAAAGTPITVQRAGADTINDAGAGTNVTSVTINAAFKSRSFESNGSSTWLASSLY